MTLTLDDLNRVDEAEYVSCLNDLYPSDGWVAQRSAAARPFRSIAQLKHVLASVVRAATHEEQLSLIRAHPDLGRPQNASGSLPDSSAHEQRIAGLENAATAELQELERLNLQYRSQFGFPFLLAVRGPRGSGLSKAEILQAMRRRMRNSPDLEQAEALRNLHRIAALRLNDLLGYSPEQGNTAWDWAAELARHSEQDDGRLTVTYLTEAHQACASDLASWMKTRCGFDQVSIDAVGNVVGIYQGTDESVARLLTGSHYDTVRDAGRFDGRLAIFVPMLRVQMLYRQGRRMPFAIEVVAFAEEEGQRFGATFLGSGALAGQFDPAWLELRDADGLAMHEVIRAAGHDVQAIPSIARDPAGYLGFVEVHIEQGPVLDALDLPLGVVSSINGSARFRGEIIGTAGHAGTTPMGARRDAAAAAAELVTFVEGRAAQVPDLVGTVGMLAVPDGSVNVIAGRCEFSLDIRATTDEVRDACVRDVREALDGLCARRGVRYRLQQIMQAPAAPSAAQWQVRWERAVTGLGLPAFKMPSGAGHDAMKLHQIMPQAMLFVRGENGGISHNPLESTNSDDIQLAIDAFAALISSLAQDLAG